MSTGGQCRRLRLMTYLAPSLPLTLYQTIQYYLEEVLGRDSYLMVESRVSGPIEGQKDPFTEDDADIVFLSAGAYMKLKQEGNRYMELLPVAPVFSHPLAEDRPVYFSDVIVHKTKGDKYKEFLDLKGHRWAYSSQDSSSGYKIMLLELKRLGFNTSFFGDLTESGSDHQSIELVASAKVDGASIDGNVLRWYLEDHPEYKDQIHTLCSWGPMPIQPILVNTRMDASDKDKIVQALLAIHKSEKWGKQLDKFHLSSFVPIDETHYDEETELSSQVKNMKKRPVYY